MGCWLLGWEGWVPPPPIWVSHSPLQTSPRWPGSALAPGPRVTPPCHVPYPCATPGPLSAAHLSMWPPHLLPRPGCRQALTELVTGSPHCLSLSSPLAGAGLGPRLGSSLWSLSLMCQPGHWRPPHSWACLAWPGHNTCHCHDKNTTTTILCIIV